MQFVTKYKFRKPSFPPGRFFNLVPKYTTDSVEGARPGFYAYRICQEFVDFEQVIKDYFEWNESDNNFLVWIQEIKPTFNGWVHKDPRVFALNYILDQGGENVTTSFYDDQHRLLDTQKLDSNVWYGLSTSCNHAVHDIQTTRLALSLSFISMNNKIKTLLNRLHEQ